MIGIPGKGKKKAGAARASGRNKPSGHSPAHDAHDGDDPLSFFTAPDEGAAKKTRRKSGGHHRMLLIASGAGALAGLAAVGVLFSVMGKGAPGGQSQEAASAPELLWQRPVITAKSDLSEEIGKTISTRPQTRPALGAPAMPPVRESGDGQAPMRLMTAFATPGMSAASGWNTSASRPAVLEASLVLAPEGAGNETIITKSPPPEPVDTSFVLGKGEKIHDKLVELGVPPSAARALMAALEPVYPSRLMRAGQKISLTLDRQQDFYGSEVIYPVYLSFRPGRGAKIVVESDEDGHFTARAEGLKSASAARKAKSAKAARASGKRGQKARAAAAPYIRARGRVSSSLYAAARDQHVPGYIISQMLRAFSYSIDLQRQVAKGDTFDILYGAPLSGSSKRRKVLYYAALNLHGKRIAYFRFTTPGGRTGYYDEKGRSAVRGLMRTPVSGARITSGFGMRRHPVLGYSKMHTGVDFGAPRGTPIHAAGNGVVTYAAWRGGYGRAVMIRHDNGYVTLYAHQSRIARGIRKGVRVRQGQVIGYVGSTGRSTGPHLHFEVRLNNRPVNPLHVRASRHIRLKGKALAAFKKRKARILALLRQAPATALVARK